MQDLLASLDSPAGLAVLAALAFGDTLIGVGFFVFGELAFLAAGAAITANGAYLPALIVLFAAWAGDVASYTIGATYGARISPLFLNRLKRRKVWRRARVETEHRGAAFVVKSRSLGSVAWVTPFLAGTLGMPRRVFLGAAVQPPLIGPLLGVFSRLSQARVVALPGPRGDGSDCIGGAAFASCAVRGAAGPLPATRPLSSDRRP